MALAFPARIFSNLRASLRLPMASALMLKKTLLSAVFLACVLTNTQAAPRDVRVYVLYGQGGSMMARGMKALTESLQKMDSRLQVSMHEWKDHRDVVKKIANLPADMPVVLIGYSLGANATTWISNELPSRMIELIVAYDPTVLSEVQPAGRNVKRVLLYHNNSLEPFGHARIQGPQVETVETKNTHFSVGSSSWLHGKTRTAVSQVLAEIERGQLNPTSPSPASGPAR